MRLTPRLENTLNIGALFVGIAFILFVLLSVIARITIFFGI